MNEDKMMIDHQYLRRKLYCDVYIAIANHSTAGGNTARAWASRAVQDFDDNFKVEVERWATQ